MIERLKARIAKYWKETDQIIGMELVREDGSPLPPYNAGAHIDIIAPNGMCRQYSLCGSPSKHNSYTVGILLDPNSRGASQSIHENLTKGDIIEISSPKNNFPLRNAQHSILLAGGIGITPLLSMSEHLQENLADFELHYFARSRDRTAFTSRLSASLYASKVKYYFNDESPPQKHSVTSILASPNPGTHLYLCGPGGFIDFVKDIALKTGWTENTIHFERFNSDRTLQNNTTDFEFNIRIASTGAVFHIPNGKSITNVLASNGISIPVSCEEGICGTCITSVLEGKPNHLDDFFSEEEKLSNREILPCCSRSLSKELVLDL